MATSSRLFQLIEANCRRLKLAADQDITEQLLEYTQELIRWNRRINLTGAKSEAQFIEGPLFDAMTLIPVWTESSSFVDIGSGGGLPGIPAMLMRPIENATLVEPRSKRAVFLRHIAAHLGLFAAIEETRIESLYPQKWSAAVAQAVFDPLKWIDLARRYVTPGGYIYVLSSKPVGPLPADVSEAFAASFENPLGAARYSYRLQVLV